MGVLAIYDIMLWAVTLKPTVIVTAHNESVEEPDFMPPQLNLWLSSSLMSEILLHDFATWSQITTLTVVILLVCCVPIGRYGGRM